jgi:hypothetical protein
VRSFNRQTFVRFGDNLVNDCLDIVRAFVRCELSIRASAFAHNAFDVRHLALRAKLVYLTGYELKQFVQ